jgi:quercetin dioxygenase-like cupin family protein
MSEHDAATSTRPLVGHAAEQAFAKGRRDFLTFRDTGVADASGGKMSAVVLDIKQGQQQSTGWHYHECDHQLVYMLAGWSEMEIEGQAPTRLEAGDVLYLPGGVVHNEIQTSDDMRALEITLPAAMGTVPCDPPDGRA